MAIIKSNLDWFILQNEILKLIMRSRKNKTGEEAMNTPREEGWLGEEEWKKKEKKGQRQER